MRIELNLDSHCVETEIRRIYKMKVRSCLRDKRVTPHDADVIELLKKLLETVDFPRLRSLVDGILQGGKWPVALIVDGDGIPWIEVNELRIGVDSKQ
jgi:hypothetical protein